MTEYPSGPKDRNQEQAGRGDQLTNKSGARQKDITHEVCLVALVSPNDWDSMHPFVTSKTIVITTSLTSKVVHGSAGAADLPRALTSNLQRPMTARTMITTTLIMPRYYARRVQDPYSAIKEGTLRLRRLGV